MSAERQSPLPQGELVRSAGEGRARRRLTLTLFALAIGMFGFAFALTPLYDAFCEWTGLNGRIALRASPEATPAEAQLREVTVQFLAHTDAGLPVEFRPTQSAVRVRVGALTMTQFHVRNRAAVELIGRAVPSVAPAAAAPHLAKLECFCFSPQRLASGAAAEWPVRFYVSKDLPAHVRTLTLSYTLFRAEDDAVATAREPS